MGNLKGSKLKRKMKPRRNSFELIQRVYRDFAEFREAIKGSIFPVNTLLFGMDGSVLLSIPHWDGFSCFFPDGDPELQRHYAHWENHFMEESLVLVILQIDWRRGPTLRLGFSYPHYREILDHIWERRAIGLIDRPLRNGFIDPQSRCLLVENLPPWGAVVA